MAGPRGRRGGSEDGMTRMSPEQRGDLAERMLPKPRTLLSSFTVTVVPKTSPRSSPVWTLRRRMR
ncbi:hypothetical protein D3C59_37135 [Streptomyces sp. SHP22-7]|nr:hypothetical protein D3C59_37135 [Streptomyces sp. SHP22-7]